MSVNEKPPDADDEDFGDHPYEPWQEFWHNQRDTEERENWAAQRDAQPHKNVPERLMQAAEDKYDKIETLLFSALDTERTISARCPGCNKTVPVVIPDWTARLNALKQILDRYGMPGRAPDPPKPPPDRATMTELEAMTNSELAAYIAARRG